MKKYMKMNKKWKFSHIFTETSDKNNIYEEHDTQVDTISLWSDTSSSAAVTPSNFRHALYYTYVASYIDSES